MVRLFFALTAGGLFGLGLMISGMTDTAKVQGFLDITGAWDPTLMFVMGGAIVPMAIAWRSAQGTPAPMLGGDFPARPPVRLDRDLVVGSAMFGAGWALAGLCPGPALASLSYGGSGGLAFASALVLGMLAAPKLKGFGRVAPMMPTPETAAPVSARPTRPSASRVEPTLRAMLEEAPAQSHAGAKASAPQSSDTAPAQRRPTVIQGPALALPLPQKDT